MVFVDTAIVTIYALIVSKIKSLTKIITFVHQKLNKTQVQIFQKFLFLKCTKVTKLEKPKAAKSVVTFAMDQPNETKCRMCRNQLKGFKIKYSRDDNLCFECWNNNKSKLSDLFELIGAGFCDFCGLTFKDNVDHAFICTVCDNYELCLKCYRNGYFSKNHSLNHPVLTKRTPWKFSQ